MLLEQLTLKDLRKIAREYNKVVKIAGYTKFSKEELITALNKHIQLEENLIKFIKHNDIDINQILPEKKKRVKKNLQKEPKKKDRSKAIKKEPEEKTQEQKEKEQLQKELDELHKIYDPLTKQIHEELNKLKKEYKEKFGYEDLEEIYKQIKGSRSHIIETNELKKKFNQPNKVNYVIIIKIFFKIIVSYFV